MNNIMNREEYEYCNVQNIAGSNFISIIKLFLFYRYLLKFILCSFYFILEDNTFEFTEKTSVVEDIDDVYLDAILEELEKEELSNGFDLKDNNFLNNYNVNNILNGKDYLRNNVDDNLSVEEILLLSSKKKGGITSNLIHTEPKLNTVIQISNIKLGGNNLSKNKYFNFF